ncbi:MAG: hypothetical protein R3A47_03890 [Polyangiales bacterium]
MHGHIAGKHWIGGKGKPSWYGSKKTGATVGMMSGTATITAENRREKSRADPYGTGSARLRRHVAAGTRGDEEQYWPAKSAEGSLNSGKSLRADQYASPAQNLIRFQKYRGNNAGTQTGESMIICFKFEGEMTTPTSSALPSSRAAALTLLFVFSNVTTGQGQFTPIRVLDHQQFAAVPHGVTERSARFGATRKPNHPQTAMCDPVHVSDQPIRHPLTLSELHQTRSPIVAQRPRQ